MSYNKSLLAVGGVLEFLKTKVPVCSSMVDALFTAVHESQVQSGFSPPPPPPQYFVENSGYSTADPMGQVVFYHFNFSFPFL